MTTLINDFTGGVDGSTITNANSASGGSAFNETDTPQVGSGASIFYSTSHGFPAMAITTGATSSTARRGWSVNPTASTVDQYIVFYFDLSEVASTSFFPVRAMNADSSQQCMRVQINASGFLFFRDSGNGQIWTSTQLSPGVRYRVEVRYGASASATGQVKIFEDEGTTPVQDSGVLTGVNFFGPAQSIWFGQTASFSNATGKLIRRVGWSDVSWLGPYSSSAEAYLDVHLGTGVPTNTAVKVSQRWVNATSFPMRLVVSTSSALTSPIYGSSTSVDAGGWVQLSATGLSPNTVYYGGVEVNGTLSVAGRFSFRTAPFDGDGVSHSIFFGGGRQVNGGEEAFAVMKSMVDSSTALEGRAIFLADLGNNGFPNWAGGTTEDQVLNLYAAQAAYSTIPAAMGVLPWAFTVGSLDGASLATVQSAFRRAVPAMSLPSATALYRSFDWGRVRYILPDNWSERSPVGDPDGPNKKMWSQAQEDWFINQVKSWPWAVCVLGGVSCRQVGSSSEGWGSYADQFKRIHDRLNVIDSLRRLVWLSANRAALAADLGVTAGTRGVPQAVAGPFDANSVDLPSGEQWSVGYYNVVPNGAMTAFGEASFSDSGGSTITFTYYGRTTDGTIRVQASKVLDVAPRVFWRRPKGI